MGIEGEGKKTEIHRNKQKYIEIHCKTVNSEPKTLFVMLSD